MLNLSKCETAIASTYLNSSRDLSITLNSNSRSTSSYIFDLLKSSIYLTFP